MKCEYEKLDYIDKAINFLMNQSQQRICGFEVACLRQRVPILEGANFCSRRRF